MKILHLEVSLRNLDVDLQLHFSLFTFSIQYMTVEKNMFLEGHYLKRSSELSFHKKAANTQKSTIC